MIRHTVMAVLAAGMMTVCTVDASPRFDDEALQARYQHLVDTLRCPKCENQSIGSSGAPIAQDMAQRVEQWLRQGVSDDEIRQKLVDRFGEYVLYEPPLSWRTGLLWGGPALLVIAALSGVVLQIRRNRHTSSDQALDPEEQQRLAAILARHADASDLDRQEPRS